MKRRLGPLLLFWGATPCAVYLSLCARGAETEPEHKRTVIELIVLGDVDAALATTLRELAGRVHLSVRSSPLEVPDGAIPADTLARVDVDARSPDGVRVVIVDARDGRNVLKRNVPRQSSPAVTVAEVALVVRWALDALLEGRRKFSNEPPAASSTTDSTAPAPTSVTNESTAPVAPSPPNDSIRPMAPPPVDDPRSAPIDDTRAGAPLPWAFDVGALACARTFAFGTPALMGGGLSTDFEFGQSVWRPAVWASAMMHVPVGASRDGVQADATVVSLRLAPSVALHESSELSIDAGLGAGVDFVRVTAKAVEPAASIVSNPTVFDPVVCGVLTARLRLSKRASVLFSLEGDVDLAPRRYVVDTGAGHDAALDVMPLRVAAAAGFAFQVGGTERPQ